MKSSLRVTGMVIVALLLSVFLTVSPAIAQDIGQCELVTEPVWAEGDDVLDLLRRDPQSFGTYIRDLEQNQRRQRELEDRVEQWLANTCIPVVSQLRTHEDSVRSHDGRCENVSPDLWIERDCQTTYDAILRSKSILDPKLAAMGDTAARLNAESEVNENAQKRAIERAREILDSARGASVFDDSEWSGTWSEEEKELVHDVLRALKDGKLRNWIAANVELNRSRIGTSAPPSSSDMISSSGSTVNFKDSFFLPRIGDTEGEMLNATRENLFAFEAGKALYESMKDEQLEGGETLGTWFMRFKDEHERAILVMKAAEHKSVGLSEATSDLVADPYSAFGYIFRAQALQVQRPSGRRAQQEWDRIIREFQRRADEVLRGGQ